MEISIIAVNASGALITGAAASTALKIRRVSDGYLLDWDDLTFKASGWGHSSTAMLEVDATNFPGEYRKVVVITTWTDGFYQAFVHFDDATTVLNFIMEQYVQGGHEVELNSDALVSSRATVATILAGTIEDSITVAHAMQAILAACAGKSDGGGSTTIHFRDQADSKNRITATVDANGDRTAITLSYD